MHTTMRPLITMVSLLLAGLCQAQDMTMEADTVFDLANVQEQPDYPGGMEKMYAFMKKHTKYPTEAYRAGVQGKVYIQFDIGKDGAVQNVIVRRGVHPALDAEARRVVASMPKWKPGRIDGVPVPVRFTIPVDFKSGRSPKKN